MRLQSLPPSNQVTSVLKGEKKAFNYDLEALRGFAALLVVWCHSGDPTFKINPGYLPGGVWAYGPCGHFCVILFFILSGYVIGITNPSPLTGATTKTYLKKRFVRLYPIFLLTLLFTVLVSPTRISLQAVTGNLILLQGTAVPEVINKPSWSLVYEAGYYLFFIGISMLRLNPFVVAAAALVVGSINYFLYHFIPTAIVTPFSYGLLFWLLGLGMSQKLVAARSETLSKQTMLGAVLFLLCVDQYNPFKTVLEAVAARIGLNFALHHVNEVVGALNFSDFAYLPYALALVFVFLHQRIPYRLPLLKVLMVVSALKLLYHLGLHGYRGYLTDFDKKYFVQPAFFMLVALVCVFWRSPWLEYLGGQVLRVGAWLGTLSYGIYLVHFPLMLLFGRITVLSGTPATSALRFVLFIALSIGLGYILEIKIQPIIRNLFFKAPSSVLQSA